MVLDSATLRALLAQPSESPFDLRAVMGPEARDAAVLVPLTDSPDGLVVHVLVRSAALRDHAGEVGFPGGKVEAGESLERALAREVEEETGLGEGDVEVLGRLHAVPVVTGRYLIHPFVGLSRRAPQITSTEHARLYDLPLARWLEGREPIEITEAPWRGLPLLVPHFRVGEHVMYGASAAILFDLLSRLSPEPLPTTLVTNKPWGDRYRRHEG
jgi:8-oxo-dGTP pyrophosphatase MutT (NUDIX family)